MRTKLPLLGLVTAIALVGAMSIGGPSFAGSGAPAKDTGPLSTTVWKTFSTAAQGGTSVVVSTDGNVLSFTSPSGYQHIYGEGYALCYGSTSAYSFAGTARGGSDMVGFSPSTQGTSNVLTTTSDGKLSLNQVFTWGAANRQLTIAMTVKNLSASPIAVTVLRIADLDIDNSSTDDWHVVTWKDSYLAFETHGLMLREISKPSTATNASAITYNWFDATDCGYTPVISPVKGDYSGLVGFNLVTLGAYASKTVKVAYMRY